MKTNLSPANLARRQKAIHQKYCFAGYGVKSYYELIQMGVITHARISKEPSVRWNRVRFNCMDWSEQKEYERKLDIMVPVYMLCTSADSAFKVPKMVYDYYVALNKPKHQLV